MKTSYSAKKILILFLIFSIAYAYALSVEKPSKCKQQASATRLFKQEQPEIIKKNIFKDGEVINFGIYSYGVRVGSGQLDYLGVEKIEGQKCQRVIFKASTISVKDEDDVKGSLDFAFPVRVDRDVSLLGRNELISEYYSSDKKRVTIHKVVNKSAPQIEEIESPTEFNNVLLFLYRVRNDEEIKEGKVYAVNLPTQKFDLFVDSKMKIKVPLGEFEVFYIESRPPKYKIWLQTQGSRLPVKIQGLVVGGMVYLAATEVYFSDQSKRAKP